MIDQRRLGDEVQAPILPPHKAPFRIVVAVAIHRIETRTQEEVGQQIEGGIHPSRHETLGHEVGHKDLAGVRYRLIGRQGHQRCPLGRKVGVRGIDRIEAHTQRKPTRARHIEEFGIGETCAVPLPIRTRVEPALAQGTVLVTTAHIDGREFEIRASGGIEVLIEGVFRKIIALVPGIGEGKGKRYPVDCFAKAYTAMMS